MLASALGEFLFAGKSLALLGSGRADGASSLPRPAPAGCSACQGLGGGGGAGKKTSSQAQPLKTGDNPVAELLFHF